MNSLSSGNCIRLKINPELVCRFDNVVSLSHPREDNDGNYYVCSHAGEIIKFNEQGKHEVLLTIGGQPSGIAFDPNNNIYYTDVANAAIYYKSHSGTLSKEDENDSDRLFRKDYEGFPFKGPTSIAYNKEEDIIIYCDSGSFGSSSLNRPNGSVYVDDITNNIIRPLLFNCLANPSDLVFDPHKNVIYICETFTNRIIRITLTANNTQSSVFYQFSGRVGPTAIAIDDSTAGNIYIARYEFQSNEEVDGLISVITRDGALVGELIIPKLPEITGLMIPSKNKDQLYFTERNTNGVLSLKLNPFINQISNFEDNNKILY